jgi:hypothetical protein
MIALAHEHNLVDKSLPPTPAVGPATTAPNNVPGTAAPAVPANGNANNTSARSAVPAGVTNQTQPSQPPGLNGSTPSAPKPTPNGDKAAANKKSEKQDLMNKMQPPKGSKPIDVADQKGEHWETDPVTGQKVLIRNLNFEGASSVY